MRFAKPPKTFEEQVGILCSRGMEIDDPERVRRYLSHLNYYRLAAYWLPFEQDHPTHRFQPGTRFNTVLEHYIFDRELRLLVMDAIERLEVSLRTRWAYYLSHTYGPHAHLESRIFKLDGRWSHEENLRKLKDVVDSSAEVFIRHFDRYDEELPPVWVVCEVMTLGQLSKWYANLRHSKDRNAIAEAYGLDEVNLTSFLHHLSIVRNLCAHHARLWNREFAFTWKLPRLKPVGLLVNFHAPDGRRLYNTLVMLAYLMDRINPHSWKTRLEELFTKHPEVAERHMGFPENWQDRSLWRGQIL
ncbi:Abortive infection bacteriophage resistance protein [Desulfomicrobium apsheronum]|uniref:Abortive infection bacteriophage resistance protein n=2 Tax=Desulfomicrobium apsheronum TaxID=52560 RepID=A0A1I3ZZJ7_9BACT|nr:Abortive infection bacteriophage resistance protein [Desulfomicrobium apsheronum]